LVSLNSRLESSKEEEKDKPDVGGGEHGSALRLSGFRL
jgi:hypothetical protein